MDPEFDMAGALTDLSDGLGFEPLENDDADPAPDNASGGVQPAVDPGADGGGAGGPGAGPVADPAKGPVAGIPGVQPAGAPVAGPGSTPADPAVPAVSAAPGPNDPPATWTAGAKAEWAALTPTVQAEIRKRENDFHAGLETYKQDASWGKGIKDVLAPYLPILQQHNVDPMQQVKSLMNAHYTFATGSAADKGKLLGQLLADYKIDPMLVPLPGDAPEVAPEVAALRQELQEVKTSLSKQDTDRAQRSLMEQQARIDTFFNDSKNLYVNELGIHMSDLIAKGLAKDLPDAYEQAIWLNPVTRDKEMARRTAEQATVQKTADEAKAEAARKASAANVRARPKSGAATGKLGSMDDTMQATLAAIHARDG